MLIDSNRDNSELEDSDGVESGDMGAVVQLLKARGQVVATTTTDASGSYFFSKVIPGIYSVKFQEPASFDFVNEDASIWTFDSDADAKTGQTDCFYVGAGCKVSEIDAGIAPLLTGSVSGRAYLDFNGDNTELKGRALEAGQAGVEVNLVDANGQILSTMTTDADGKYPFQHVVAGNYSVQFVEPSGFDFVTEGVGDIRYNSNANVDTGSSMTFSVVSGASVTKVDADFRAAPIDPVDDLCPTGDPIGTEQFDGTTGDDVLETRDGYASTIAGNTGDDRILGGDYGDFLLGNGGNDTLDGGCDADTLHGGTEDDLILGGSGDDIILSGFGQDTILGGIGADTFRLNSRLIDPQSFDTIEDFERTEGDQFDLLDIDLSRVTLRRGQCYADLSRWRSGIPCA